MTGSNNTIIKTAVTSNELVDELVRQMFGVEPDVMASLAHGDDEVQLRRWPGSGPSSDPLDGLEVFMRRTIGACLAMLSHDGAVALVTERQARDAGWPTARFANMSLAMAFGMAITEPAGVLPLLVEADEDADGSDCLLLRADDHLPTLEDLLAALRRGQHPVAERERIVASGPAIPRALVSLAAQLGDWLGVDALAVELPSDRLGMALSSADARAVGVVSWIVTAALRTASAMAEESVTAVRIKTDLDAHLAGQPGATAANLALLLAAAVHHGAGVTVHFLAARDDIGAALVEAGRRIGATRGQSVDEDEAETVDLLELRDHASRGYVHVGRRAAKDVAQRVYDAQPVTEGR